MRSNPVRLEAVVETASGCLRWVTASSFTASPERPILQTMNTLPSRPQSRMVLAGIGVALGFLMAAWLGFAIVVAAFVPGHWGDLLRIASVCLVVLAMSAVLIRIGRTAQDRSALQHLITRWPRS
jgi:hypothetical protein